MEDPRPGHAGDPFWQNGCDLSGKLPVVGQGIWSSEAKETGDPTKATRSFGARKRGRKGAYSVPENMWNVWIYQIRTPDSSDIIRLSSIGV